MKILALEFSSSQRSVAVVQAGPTSTERSAGAVGRPGSTAPDGIRSDAIVVAEVVETGAGTAQPLGMIDDALRQSGLEREQIECLVIGLGPGSYTGIRAAIAMAQGWQLASSADGLKLIGISSAEAMAAQARAEGQAGRVTVVIDAQRGEFYVAVYQIVAGGCREIEPLRIVSLSEARRREQAGDILIGPEITRWFPAGRSLFPRASTLGELAVGRNDFVTGEKLEPIYLRETKFVKAPAPRVRSRDD